MDEDNTFEDYTRAFINKFGLISPDQDWTDATRSSVTVDFGTVVADDVKVMCEMGGNLYLLASHNNLTGRTKIKFDMPKGITEVIVSVDGRRYTAEPGGRFSIASSRACAPARGDDDSDDSTPLKWLMVAEDLGDVGDFDFNDFIAQIYFGAPSPIAFDAYVEDYEDNDEGEIHLTKAPSRAINSGDYDNHLVVSALAAGGTIKLWLHYRSATTGEDYLIGPGNSDGYAKTSDLDSGSADRFEWHQWFYYGNGVNYGHTRIINTGQGSISLKGIEITLPFKGEGTDDGVIDSDFSAENYSVLVKTGNSYAIGSGFYVTVYDYQAPEPDRYIVLGKVIGRTDKGDAPQMFLIPDAGVNHGWSWPIERKSVELVYPLFKDWCARPNENQTWYVTPQGQPGADYYVRR